MDTKHRITVWHRVDADWPWAEFAEAHAPVLELAYSYDGVADTASLWRANNRVDGSIVEVVPDGARSLSVGDVVTVDDEDTILTVSRVGWSTVDAADFAAAVVRWLKQDDQIR